MASVIVTTACDIIHPIYGSVHFNVGAVVSDASPYYFPLINSGNTNAVVPGVVKAAQYAGNLANNQILKWDSAQGLFVPTSSGGGGGADGIGITGVAITGGHLIVSYSDGSSQDVGQVVGSNGSPGAPGNNGLDASNFFSVGTSAPSDTSKLWIDTN